MSKKGNKKTANKSLETLKRKQYARGGRRGNPPARKAAQPVQELKQIKSAPISLKTKIKSNVVSDPSPKPIGNKGIDPKSLFSDPVRVGGIKNPKDIKLPEPSRSTGGGRGQPLGNQPLGNSETIKNAQYTPKGTSNLANLKDSLGSQEIAQNMQSQDVAQQSMMGRGSEIIPQTVENNNGYKAGTGVADGVNKSQGQFQQSMMGSDFTGLTPAQLAKLVEDYGGGYNPNQDGQVDNGQETTADTDPSGGPKDKATLIGLDGREYSSNAALEAANARYLAAQAAENATTKVTTQGITKEAPTGISQKAPVADLRQMTADTILSEDGTAPAGTVTSDEDIQKLKDATDATSSTVTAQGLTAEQGRASQAEVAGVVPKAEQWADKLVDQYPDLTDSQRKELRAWGVSNRQGSEAPFPAFFSDMDFLKGLEAANNMEFNTTSRDATTYKATTTEGKMDKTVAAQQTDPLREAEAGQVDVTAQAPETQRDDAAEKAALGTFADRPEYKNYATAARDDSDYGFDTSTVDEPKVTISDGVTIPQSKVDEIRLDAEKRGLDPTDALKAYSEAMVQRTVQKGDAAEGTAVTAGVAPSETAAQADFLGAADVAAGQKEQIADVGEAGFAGREGRTADSVGAVPAAQAGVVDGIGVADRNFATGEVLTEAEKVETNLDAMPVYEKAAERVAQVGEASTRIANELGTAPSIDLKEREAITGEAPIGNAAQIGGIPTMAAATMQAVTGKERTVAAADMMAVVANIPEDITAAITQDPATVEAQLDSGADPSVTAAVAALPVEALVSTQMEGLLAGMEDGETPAWARPAVAAIEAQMARRGLSASTVGRDALFNAIIQSALPMAQSNAQALQQRAQQNLSNEQQANLASAQNTMQVRMQNLANRQTAASQTAEMAQQIKVQQGSFDQQAVMTSAQQQQDTSMANAQMAQQRAQQVSAQNQQAAIAELNTNAQMDLANLQAESARSGKQMDADQQARLQTYNAQVSRTMRKADLQQDMEKANLSTGLQVELANLSEKNVASRDSMSAVNQERLTRLSTLVDFKKTNATLAQQMDLANMSNEQQINMAELAERAATDTANFTEDNRFELQRLQTYAQFMSQNTELAQQTELANFTASEKINLANLMAENQASSENLNKDQQVELANLNTKLKTETLNAELRQQAISQTFTQAQQVELANLESLNRADSESLTNEQQSKLTTYNAKVQRSIRQTELNSRMEEVNLDARLKVELSELSEKNTTERANMTTDQQMRLANLNTLVDFKKTNAGFAQQMELANLGNEQQMELANLQERSNVDAANFTEANRSRTQELNTFVQVMSQNEQLKQNADMANLSMEEKINLANLSSQSQADMASMSAEECSTASSLRKEDGGRTG